MDHRDGCAPVPLPRDQPVLQFITSHVSAHSLPPGFPRQGQKRILPAHTCELRGKERDSMVQISQVLWKVYLLRASLSLYSRSSQTTGAFHPYSAYPLKEFLYPRHSVYRARGVFNRPPETVCKKPGSIRNAQSYAEEWAFLWALQKPPSARECPLSCPAVIWGSLIGSLAWLCTTSREPAHTQSKKRFKIQYLRA